MLNILLESKKYGQKSRPLQSAFFSPGSCSVIFDTMLRGFFFSDDASQCTDAKHLPSKDDYGQLFKPGLWNTDYAAKGMVWQRDSHARFVDSHSGAWWPDDSNQQHYTADNNPPLPQPPNTSKQPDCNQTSSASSLSSSPSATTTTTTIKLSGVNATETVMQCTLDNGSSMKLKVDALQTDKKWVTVSLMAIPPSVYDSEVAAFDSSVKTLKVEDAIDMNNTASAGSVTTVNSTNTTAPATQNNEQAATLKLVNHIEKIILSPGTISSASNGTAAAAGITSVAANKGDEIDLDIQSSSNITDFSFNQTSRQISFKVSGQSGTNGTTIVQDVGKLLKGPYVVTFDGQVKTDYQTLTNKTTGDVIGIQITYHHSSHVITIAGAEVVPEFAVGGIGTITILGVVTGFLIFVRARLTSSRSRFFAIFTASSVAFLLVGGEIASMQPKFAAYAASPDLFVSTT